MSASENVLRRIEDNNINGELFFQLTEEDLKEIAPVFSDRILLRNLKESVKVFCTLYMQLLYCIMCAGCSLSFCIIFTCS